MSITCAHWHVPILINGPGNVTRPNMRRPRLSCLWPLLFSALLLLYLRLPGVYEGYYSPYSVVPDVSVILPVYNAAAFVGDALAALDKQSHKNFELIIVDDGSTDRTHGIVSAWAHSRPWARVVRFERNSGLPAALNAGLRASRAPWLTWVSADNVQYPNFIAALRNAVAVCRDCDLVFADHDNINEAGQAVSEHVLRRPPRLATMVNGNPGLAAFLFRRECLAAAGDYSDDLQGVEDWEMWGLMLSVCRGRALYVAAKLMGYRMHEDRLTNRLGSRRAQLEDKARLAMWDHAHGAAGLTEHAALEVELLWNWELPVVHTQLLGSAAQAFADRYMARPSASLLTVLTDTLSACIQTRPVSVHTVACAANAVVLAATTDNNITLATDPAVLAERKAYALYRYEQLGTRHSAPDSVMARIGRVLKSDPMSMRGSRLDDWWVPLTPSRELRHIQRLLDSAYTFSAEETPLTVLRVDGSVANNDAGVVRVKLLPAAVADTLVQLSGLGPYIVSVEPNVVHVSGVEAIGALCSSSISLPRSMAIVAEVAGDSITAVAKMQCSRVVTFFLVSDRATAYRLARQAGVEPGRILVFDYNSNKSGPGAVVTKSLVHRLAAAAAVVQVVAEVDV